MRLVLIVCLSGLLLAGSAALVFRFGYVAGSAKPPLVVKEYVEVPGPTVKVEVPGPTVEVPGPTRYVDRPGPTKIVHVPRRCPVTPRCSTADAVNEMWLKDHR